jgi:hypothetical protein
MTNGGWSTVQEPLDGSGDFADSSNLVCEDRYLFNEPRRDGVSAGRYV